ncbi:unnamed protein product [Ranitomeya imitator]|uniref:Helix-turn-helix domain-containing protein n=1 Tax=Ranitomeya imitator TaxID=111125 RepID=A0ABN9MI88_9NEOB|nr:unnamed protein product [Ranitomeya imitator]
MPNHPAWLKQNVADPTSLFKDQLDCIINGAFRDHIVTKKEVDFLITPIPTVPTFYALPKFHKSLVEPPGRPIVSGIGSIFERPCIYVDHFLQPLVTSLKSFTRDSTHLLQLLEEREIPDNTLLISMDVESLYTSIAHRSGMQAVTYFLEKAIDRSIEHDNFILRLLHFILDKNYFVFDRKFFRQISGTAMGACCAPTYANLFLGWWEETVVYQHNLFSSRVHTWQRYIDDILLIWTGPVEDCNQFIWDLNVNNLNIKLTSVISETNIDFLDLRLSIMDSRIVSGLHRKTTATNSLLHFTSFHTFHLRKGIPKGQFLRVRRNCSTDDEFRHQAKDLSDRFKKRGYPQRLVSGAFQHALQQDRKHLFEKRNKASQICFQGLIGSFGLAISLRMESRGKRQVNAHPTTKGSPKPRNKLGTSVRNNILWNAMQTNHMLEEQRHQIRGGRQFRQGYQMDHLRKVITDHPND